MVTNIVLLFICAELDAKNLWQSDHNNNIAIVKRQSNLAKWTENG